jgi:hypothetical protein
VANTVTVALDANSLSALENVTVTVGAAITGTVTVSNFPASQAVTFSAVSISNLPATQAVSLASVPTHGVTLASTTVTVSSLPAISGTVTANGLTLGGTVSNVFPIGVETPYSGVRAVADLIGYRLPISLGDSQTVVSASIYDPLPAGTNRIGVVTIGAGTVTIGAGTAQIGSVTASISGTVPVSGTFWQTTQPVSLTSTTVTVSSLPALTAGTAQIGSVTASISGTVPVSGTFWQATQPVSGTFYQATQPVSLASVPVHAVTLTSTTVTVSSLPALAAGTAQIGSVTASISNTVTVGNSVTIGSLPAISGAVTVSQLPRVTLIDNSGSITIANSAVTVFASSTTRSYLLVQVTTGSVFLNVGATATTLNGISLTAGQGYAWETTIPQGIVSLISTTTGSLYVAKQA